MIQKLLFTVLICVVAMSAIAQQIPLGSCGIVYIHDAAGNRTKRVYFCNNGGTYPQRPIKTIKKDETIAPGDIQLVKVLYPNPTTGIFNVTFNIPLNNATVSIFDATGKMVKQIKANGSNQQFSLNGFACGMYIVRIINERKTIEMKVLKQ